MKGIRIHLLILLLLYGTIPKVLSEPGNLFEILLIGPAESTAVDSLESMLYYMGQLNGFGLNRYDPTLGDVRPDALRAYNILVLADDGQLGFLGRELQFALEGYLIGDEKHAGGALVAIELGKQEAAISRGNELLNWEWYQNLIEVGAQTSMDYPSPNRYNQLLDLKLSSPAQNIWEKPIPISFYKQLPHPSPEIGREGGRFFYSALAGGINYFGRKSDGEFMVPLFQMHLSDAIMWAAGFSDASHLQVNQLILQVSDQQKQVELDWKTAFERGLDYFVIQRGDDGQHWQNIDRILAVGNTDSMQTYQYTDLNQRPGRYFYRIQMVDVEGGIRYSSPAVVDFQVEDPAIQLYPNPVENQLYVQISVLEESQMQLQLESGIGLPLYKQQLGAVTQYHESMLDVSHLSPGIYQLKIITEKTEVVRHFVKY